MVMNGIFCRLECANNLPFKCVHLFAEDGIKSSDNCLVAMSTAERLQPLKMLNAPPPHWVPFIAPMSRFHKTPILSIHNSVDVDR